MDNKDEEKMRITPNWVTSLKDDEIFVFGCRRSGRHWEGAAAYALEHFGAIFGQGDGRQGQSYAIATAGVDLIDIKESVCEFIEYAKAHPKLKFLVTPIGCGLGGWRPEDIAPLFRDAIDMENIWLPIEFVKLITIAKMNDKKEKAHGISATSMKRAFILFWHGLTALFVGIANWFTVVLGMRDESKYGKFIRRVVGGCFACIMLIVALRAGWSFCNRVCYRWVYNHSNGNYEYGQYISRNVAYYSCDGTDGYVKTADGKTTLSNIMWIAKPLGADSLVCYSNGEKRGYFNMFTGEPVIKAKYDHAWVFSDGLASVDDEGWIKFIDAMGNVVIDPKIPYIAGDEGYVFHGGHCVLHGNRRDKFGMIDKHGNWAMKAEYDCILPVDTFYVVSKDGKQCVLNDSLEVVIPYIYADLWLSDGMITAEMADHTLRQYDLKGNLVDTFLISGVENLLYESGELRFLKTSEFDDDGNLIGEKEDIEPTPVYKTARCKCYETSSGWYGLMSPEGKVLTNPTYSEISAIGYDLYLCKKGSMSGEVLNGKGIKVR